MINVWIQKKYHVQELYIIKNIEQVILPPIYHTVGKVHTVTHVTHPAQYNTLFYTTVMGIRLEGRVNNKQLYNNCTVGDKLTCYYIRKTYLRKKDDSKYYTFSSLKLKYYYDEEN